MKGTANNKETNLIIWQAEHNYPPQLSAEKYQSSLPPKDNWSPNDCSSDLVL